MHQKGKSFCILIVLLLLIKLSFSQLSSPMKYQALLRNTEGKIISNQKICFRVSLLDDSLAGEVIYKEIHNVFTNGFGLLEFEIGKGTNNTGVFNLNNQFDKKIYLKLEVDILGNSNYTLFAASQIISVPYSLSTNSLLLISPNGLKWVLKADNNGVISTDCITKPTKSNAGQNQINVEDTKARLNANKPVEGIGKWSLIEGTQGSFINIDSANTDFTGISGGSYKLRWTIKNLCDSSYSDVQISFLNVCPGTPKIIDVRDNKEYSTVLIGTQCWMRDNLNVGNMLATTVATLNNSIIEKYCYSDKETNCTLYGGLYPWDELMNYITTESTKGICPDGWHIPSDGEYKTLEKQLGMTQTVADGFDWRGTSEGDKLKTGGTIGFEALYAGYRYYIDKSYQDINNNAYFWTSTLFKTTNIWYRSISKNYSNIMRNVLSKNNAFSIRCIKD